MTDVAQRPAHQARALPGKPSPRIEMTTTWRTAALVAAAALVPTWKGLRN